MKKSEEEKHHAIEDVTQTAMQATADRLRKLVEEDKKRLLHKMQFTFWI